MRACKKLFVYQINKKLILVKIIGMLFKIASLVLIIITIATDINDKILLTLALEFVAIGFILIQFIS